MSDTPRVARVNPDDVKRGAMIERSEHTWMTKRQATMTATDHLRENRAYYGNSKEGSHPQSAGTVVVLNQNVKAVTPRKHRKPQPKPFNILTYGSELLHR